MTQALYAHMNNKTIIIKKLVVSKFQVLYYGIWFNFSLFLYKLRDMDLVSIFQCDYPVFPAILPKQAVFHSMYVWHF
jgi:hypothetical protein